MILVGQEKALAEPVSSTRGERRAIKVFAVVLVAVCVAAVIVAVDRSRRQARAHCVSISVASYTGAVTAEQCGARAAAWCRTAYAAPPGDSVARALRTACPRAGFRPPSG